MVTRTDARLAISRWRNRPSAFVDEVLGLKLFDKQYAMMESVARFRRTAVVGANSVGKDYTSGSALIPWWLLSHYEPAAVVVTGPTYRQVNDIVWRNARVAHANALHPLGGTMYDGSPRYEVDSERYAFGFATNKEFNLQGFHSPHLLVIVTEAHGVDQAHIDALKRLNPERFVLTGNPLALGGEFYDAFHSMRELYNCITISAWDTPNIIEGRVVIPGMVTREDIEERKQEWGEDSPMYRASVNAEFPDNLDDAIVPLTAAQAAVGRDLHPDGPGILGVDVARFGEDSTVFYSRRGPVARKVGKFQGKDLMRVVGEIRRILAADPLIETVVVDDTGVGGGVTDRLRELKLKGIQVVAFTGGGWARDHQDYYNSIAEAWWEMGKAFREGRIDIDEDKPLIAQITTRKYTIQSDRTIRLESKEDVKKRGGKSPDEGDALAMTYSPLIRRRRRYLYD